MIASLQGLRGLCFLMMFIHHAGFNVYRELPNLGVRGVELFFVLSGFLMMRQALQRGQFENWGGAIAI